MVNGGAGGNMYLKWGLCRPLQAKRPFERSQVALKGRGGRSAGLLLVRLLVVELLLDLRIAHQVVRVRLDLLGLDNLLEALTDIVIRRRLQIACLYQLDHMPPVLSLDRLVRV